MAGFDPAKDALNLAKHGVSLSRWVDLDIKKTVIDDRRDYGEVRYFTSREGLVRPISLRRAHTKEMRRHVP